MRSAVPLVAALVGAAACAAPAGSDPAALWLTRARPESAIELRNPTLQSQSLSDVRIDRPDWMAFRVLNAAVAPEIPAGGSIVIGIAVAPKSLLSTRTSRASLTFTRDGASESIPIRASEADPSRWSAGAAGMVAILALGLAIVRRIRPADAVALAIAITLVPWAGACCVELLFDSVGPRQSAQCAAGREGWSGAMLPVELGIPLWCLAVALLSRPGTSSGSLHGLATAAAACALVGPVMLVGSTDIAELSRGATKAAADPLSASCVGLSALAFVAAAAVGTRPTYAGPMPTTWLWASLGASVFLGGAVAIEALAFSLHLHHAIGIALGILILGLETWVVTIVLGRVRLTLERLGPRAPRRALIAAFAAALLAAGAASARTLLA